MELHCASCRISASVVITIRIRPSSTFPEKLHEVGSDRLPHLRSSFTFPIHDNVRYEPACIVASKSLPNNTNGNVTDGFQGAANGNSKLFHVQRLHFESSPPLGIRTGGPVSLKPEGLSIPSEMKASKPYRRLSKTNISLEPIPLSQLRKACPAKASSRSPSLSVNLSYRCC
jgi:hypothetical protein